MGAVTKKMDNHCPFGCTIQQLDENGHCRHLVGFTNDGKTMEPCRPAVNDRTGKPTGLRQTLGDNPNEGIRNVQRIRKGDEIVNPEYQQLDNGAYHTANRWVSSRVYREMPKEVQPGVPGSDLIEDVEDILPEPAKEEAPPPWASRIIERLDALEERATKPEVVAAS